MFDDIEVIKHSEVAPIIDGFQERVLDLFSVKHTIIGGAMVRELSNDIDICVKHDDPEKLAMQLYDFLGGLFAKRRGRILSVKWPFRKEEGRVQYCQIDIIVDEHPEDVAWLMNGDVFWNMLLAFMAKQMSEKKSRDEGRNVKITVAHPGGVQVVEDGAVIFERNSHPLAICVYLGLIGSHWNKLHSFDDLVQEVPNHPCWYELCFGFREYAQAFRSHPRYEASVQALDAMGLELLKRGAGVKHALECRAYNDELDALNEPF